MIDDLFVDSALTESIIGGFLETHHKLGHGFSESIYAAALSHELTKRGLRVQREFAVEVLYDGKRIGWYRLDMLIESRVVVEIKATETLPAAARQQLLNYLRATSLELGLLLHYGYRPQVRRVIATNSHQRAQRGPRPL